jgi:hypothetical protein
MAAARMSAEMLSISDPMINTSGSAATDTVTVSDAMLNRMRWSGLRPPAPNVHCAQALTVAMHVASPGPRANSAQKLTAWESDSVD